MLRIAKALGLSSGAASAPAVGAGLHDEGKKADHWQRTFHAPRDATKFGLASPLAKTRGPIDQAVLRRYRRCGLSGLSRRWADPPVVSSLREGI